MKGYLLTMIPLLIILTLIQYWENGLSAVISTYAGAFIGILPIVVYFILAKGIDYIYDLIDR